jgi:hypothetical protein
MEMLINELRANQDGKVGPDVDTSRVPLSQHALAHT